MTEIIPIEAIRKSAQEAAFAGQSACPEEYQERFYAIWMYELRVANYELKQMSPLTRAGLSDDEIMRLHESSRVALDQGEGA